MEERTDRFTALENRFAGYEVYDHAGEMIGKVDDLFVDELDNPEYVGVKMGFLAARSTLIPMEIITVEDSAGRLVTSADKQTVKEGPTFDDDREITPNFENEVYSYGAYSGGPGTTDELRVQRSEEELRAGTRQSPHSPNSRKRAPRAPSHIIAGRETRSWRANAPMVKLRRLAGKGCIWRRLPGVSIVLAPVCQREC